MKTAFALLVSCLLTLGLSAATLPDNVGAPQDPGAGIWMRGDRQAFGFLRYLDDQVVDVDIPALRAGSLALTNSVAAEAVLARNAANLTSGNVASDRMTNTIFTMFRTGVCTNGEVISFAPALGASPFVVGTYDGVPSIGGVATNAALYISSVSVNQLIFNSVPAGVTNRIYWTAVNVP